MAARGTQRVTSVQGVGSTSASLILSAASMLVACTCLGLLLAQAAQVHRLHAELRDLKLRVAGETDARRCGVPATAPSGGPEARDLGGIRMRREMQREGKRRRQRQLGKRRRTFLHLLPLSSHSYDEEDQTLLKWTTGRSQGEGLKLSGETVTVSTGGSYFIYSQVLYTDTTYVMGHVIRKRFDDNETNLLKCMKNMPANKTLALNTCYTAGVQYLESGSVVELLIPRKDAEISLLPHATFMGLYRL
ncbi:tumor necrosis factor ligand superfamily member 13 isoform X1 [Anguilla rostrata]|uniref:tumor necrosis factor ligand superfamily member 13 isoform X1 n=1 Tax=Anguilla rostrata TaxID=7938 RepID=UPI0030D098D1